MARSNAERRLIRILSDTDYGPKLARLRGEDELRILRLIDQNKGREARQEIVRLDDERKARERARRQSKRSTPPKALQPLSRKQRERRAISNILRRFGGRANRASVTDNVKFMDDDDLDFAMNADLGDLVDRATQPPYITKSGGDELNPFWYH